MRPHLVLLHAPSLFDAREIGARHGLASATVATSPLFEYYPLGFLTLLEYLERHSLDVRIINLAVKEAKSKRFDPRPLIRKLRPMAFGIDLHWLVHADGALETARICKQEHPDIPVIMGGLTASYYWRELIENPDVDYILRGDSTEEPLVQLLRAIEAKREPADVPNLVWKRGRAQAEACATLVANPFTYQPELLDIRVDYKRLMKHMLRYRDLRGGLLTGFQWSAYAFNMTLFCRGCQMNCLTCGGSNWALGRAKLGVRDPEVLAEEIVATMQLTPHGVGLPGDIRQHEPEKLIEALRRRKPTRALSFELNSPGGAEFLAKLASIGPPLDIHMSPESHDEGLRTRYGRCYTNERLEADIEHILSSGGKAFLFFLIGIPGQTRQSVIDSVAYAERLLEKWNGRYPGKLDSNISPPLPFIDPGSLAFEYPGKTGYRLFARTLAEHRALMRHADLREVLNFETDSLSRSEIIDVAVEAMDRMIALRERCGLLKGKWAEKERERVREARTGGNGR
ncbi:MAG: radical SAM protein [Armatimonadota bacterium]